MKLSGRKEPCVSKRECATTVIARLLSNIDCKSLGRAATEATKLDNKELAIIQPTSSFKDSLQLLPTVENIARIELSNADGDIFASIENNLVSRALLSSTSI